MPVSLSIKNVPDDVAERLRERAKRNHRSLQGELLALLEEATLKKTLTVEEARERVKASGLKTEPDSVQIIREMREDRDRELEERSRKPT
ncbi:MAG: Arc family DNA-binding protein [Dehalococcoidia bacterium]|nr:Arc family DNA-binding protein [Dehalococcoidia bacterium]